MGQPRRPQAIGLVETRGFVAAVEAADAMCKAARVEVARYEVVSPALVTVMVRGDLADVEAAVQAGATRAAEVGELVRSHVIPAPDSSIEFIL